jgi:hypothetical protein
MSFNEIQYVIRYIDEVVHMTESTQTSHVLVLATTNANDLTAMLALRTAWNYPANWNTSNDPCGTSEMIHGKRTHFISFHSLP